MAEQWERQERHQVTAIGPAEVDAVDLIRELHQAISEYRQIANEPANAEVPPGAVTVRTGGACLLIRIEHWVALVPAGDQPAPEAGEGEDRG